MSNEIYNAGHYLINKLVIIADAAYAQCCYLPEVIIVNFSYGNIVMVPEPGDNGFNHAPFIFERLILWYMQFYLTYAGVHILNGLVQQNQQELLPVLSL
jgi:hypothetical protein